MIGRVAALLAIDPAGLGGVILRGPGSPLRDETVRRIESGWPAGIARRRMPLGITEDRLFGSIDLSATIAAGRPVSQAGFLSGEIPQIVVLPSAERATGRVVTALSSWLDEVRLGIVIALDEALPDEPGVAAALRERLAFLIPQPDRADGPEEDRISPDQISAARRRLNSVVPDDSHITAICQTSFALGVESSRAELMALKVAAANAALAGRDALEEDDLALAAALVLAPRATRIPSQPSEPPAPPPEPESGESESESREQSVDRLPDRVLAAARAALPAELLTAAAISASRSSGRGDYETRSLTRGRRIGVMPGDPRRGARLDLVDTLRAAAPWQPIRLGPPGRLRIRKPDFRIQRRKQKSGTTIIVAVDASGSSALHRLAEAKGAVELLLADSYVRRDRVALLSFRGTKAELVLPPTRSLARARRTLSGLPGGGGTPLASALVAGEQLGRQVQRDLQGGSALFVVLTDARANVALDGSGGRAKAESDARTAAGAFLRAGIPSILIDTSPRPSAFASEIAGLMGGTYLPLPSCDAGGVSRAVRARELAHHG